MGIRVTKKGSGSTISGAMTDISFLLIIFFLVAASFIADTGIALLLPEPDSEPELVEEDELLQLEISSDGTVRLNGHLVPAEVLDQELTAAVGGLAEPIALISVEPDTVYQSVLSLMERIKDAGCSRFCLSSKEGDAVPVKVDGS